MASVQKMKMDGFIASTEKPDTTILIILDKGKGKQILYQFRSALYIVDRELLSDMIVKVSPLMPIQVTSWSF